MVITQENYFLDKLTNSNTRTWVCIPPNTGTQELASHVVANEINPTSSGGKFYARIEFNDNKIISSGAVRVGDYVRVSSGSFAAGSPYPQERVRIARVNAAASTAEYEIPVDGASTVTSPDIFLLTRGSRFFLSGIKSGKTENTGNIYAGVFGDGYRAGPMLVYPFKITPGQTFILEAPAGSSISLDNIHLNSATSGDGLVITYF